VNGSRQTASARGPFGRNHARAMLVEAAWAAAKTLGPLKAFFVRIRARRGDQIAAVLRELTVLCWYLLTRGEDCLWARPALVANKTRAMSCRPDIRKCLTNRCGRPSGPIRSANG
jgi:transposase